MIYKNIGIKQAENNHVMLFEDGKMAICKDKGNSSGTPGYIYCMHFHKEVSEDKCDTCALNEDKFFVSKEKDLDEKVNHPSHYIGKIECIDYIKDKLGDGFEDYCIGNVIKYITRYKHKGNPTEDLRKAETYLKWAIQERVTKQ